MSPMPMEVSANSAEGELRLQLKNEETKQGHAVSRDSESGGPRRLASAAVHSPPVQQTLKYFHRGYSLTLRSIVNCGHFLGISSPCFLAAVSSVRALP